MRTVPPWALYTKDNVTYSFPDCGLRRERRKLKVTHLLDHVEGELQALALKHGEQVSQEDWEVLMAVPEGDEDGHLQWSQDRKPSVSCWPRCPVHSLCCYTVGYPG